MCCLVSVELLVLRVADAACYGNNRGGFVGFLLFLLLVDCPAST